MARFTVHLFGRFAVLHDRRALGSLNMARAEELFAYLLLHRGGSCRREALAELLWGESAGAQARKYLRQTLWQLQGALGADVLQVETEWIGINPLADLELDVALLERAAERSQGTAGRDLDAATAEELRAAVRVYRGDLLEGWPQEWCLYERERLLLVHLQLLDKLMSYCEAQRAFDEAIEYGQRILSCDRARERTHRNLMRLHYLGGDRAEAVRQYSRCVTALREELDVAPSARTTALYRQVVADAPSTSALQAAGGDLARAIEDLRAVLSGFDTRVRTALELLERVAGV